MKKILVGCDGSSRQPHVLAVAMALAKANDAKLLLVRAASVPTELTREAYLLPDEELSKVLKKHAQGELDDAEQSIARAHPGTDVVGEKIVVEDFPWKALCETAKDHDVDLIVIGAHGYGLVERVFGTTAARVVNHADRSVLVVR